MKKTTKAKPVRMTVLNLEGVAGVGYAVEVELGADGRYAPIAGAFPVAPRPMAPPADEGERRFRELLAGDDRAALLRTARMMGLTAHAIEDRDELVEALVAARRALVGARAAR